jgi:hypothetical protein
MYNPTYHALLGHIGLEVQLHDSCTTKARSAGRGRSRPTSRSCDPQVISGTVGLCLNDDRSIDRGGSRSPKKKLQVFYNYATISLYFNDFALPLTYLMVGR